MAVTNGGPTPEKIDAAEAALHRQRRVELVFVIMTGIGMLATVAITAWSAQRIQSCTTPEGSCWKKNTLRARENTSKFLQDLDKEHDVLKCLLLIPPLERVEQDVIDCGG
jgi:hypothetical protein